MAVVGDAYIVVKAITSGFENDVRRAARGIDLGRDGKSVGESFSRGFGGGVSSGLSNSLSGFEKSAIRARKQFQGLIRTGYLLGPLISQLVSGIGALAGGLVSLASGFLAAAPSAVVFATALTSIGIAAIGLMGALKGVGAAISAGSKARKGSTKDVQAEEEALKRLLRATERVAEAQYDFAKATEAAKEEIQQLGFDAEDAALGEKKAAIELEKARETLQRVQDLPPNSRARREANLAFQEAELNLRRAKDRNADLRKEQERLSDSAKAAGTEIYEQTDTYLDAKKNQIDALRDQKDAQDALKKAQSGGGAADTAYADAMADLSKEAQGFVQYMVGTFIPSLKELRDALGKKLFSQLEDGLENLRTKVFPAIKPELVELGNSIGKAFGSVIKSISDIENIADLKKVLKNAGKNIESYGRQAGSLYDSFLSVLVSAQPLADRFNKFLEKKFAGWAEYLDTKQATGELDKMFNKAGDIAAKIGEVLGNAVSGIVNVVKANFTPGGGGYILIKYFKDVTEEFEKFSGSVEGQTALSDYFKAVAINTKSILGFFGSLVKEILKAGADPNVKVFWDTLKEATPVIGDILKQLNAAGPSLAKFLVSFAEFAKVTLSSGAITVFWNTLTAALDTVTNALSNPMVKEFFDTGAKILAFFSALGLISTVVVFAGKVIVGSLLSIGKVLSFLLNPIAMLRTALAPLITLIAGISAPVLIGIAAVAAFVAIFIAAYNNSEKLRNAISDMARVLQDVASGALARVKEAFEDAMGSTADLRASFERIGDFIARNIVPIFKFALAGAIGVVGGAIQGVIYAIGAVRKALEFFYNFAKGIWKLFNGDFSGAAKAFQDAFMSAIYFVRNAVKTILSPFAGAFNGIIDAINSTVGSFSFTVPSWVPKYGGQKLAFPKIPTIDIRRFAEGGTVFPSVGGTLARVAEAGRAERIEPLDPDGLSRRDKAMIEMLAGGSGGMTINVYPSKGMNESELASMVSRQIAFQLRRGGA